MPNVIKLIAEHLLRKRSKVTDPRGFAARMPRPSPQGFVREDERPAKDGNSGARIAQLSGVHSVP